MVLFCNCSGREEQITDRNKTVIQNPELPAKEASYEIAYFAEKHGISLKAAEIILTVNGSSKRMCDAAAVAFVAAVAARAGRAKKKDLPIALRGRAIRHPARSH